MYIFVGSRKVFYRSNLGGDNPKQMDVETTIPLRPGVNFITVVARESNEVLTREVLVVRRDGPDGALLETPKNGDDDLFFSDEE